MRDTLVDICFRSKISAGKEVDIGLGEGRDKHLRPADMLPYSWDGGLDVCVNMTGSSPLTQNGMIDFVPGNAVIEVAQRKRIKYEDKCADLGYGFLPFSFSSFGELEKDTKMAFFLFLLTGGLSGSNILTRGFPKDRVIDATPCKRVKYEAKCADIRYDFLPFLFSSLGELDKDAVTLLKRIRKFSVTQDIGARADVHIFNRISFAMLNEWELS
nr:hypothetical protein [Tanacetum cinerariifolium]